MHDYALWVQLYIVLLERLGELRQRIAHLAHCTTTIQVQNCFQKTCNEQDYSVVNKTNIHVPSM